MKLGKLARYNSPKNNGFTLIEILLAIALSSIVVSAAGYAIVYVSRRNQVSELQSVRRIELNRALDFIADDIREATRVQGNEDSPVDTRLQIVKADNSIIEYYYDPVTASDVWSGPGVIRRKEGTQPAEVLVDGIASDISSLPDTGCSGSDDLIAIPNTGFVVCINSAFRTADLALYGRLNIEDRETLSAEDFLIVATKFVTRNAPPPQRCIIPDLAGKTKAEAEELWDTAGFNLSNLDLIGADDETIAIQGLPANSQQDCTNTTMDAGDADDVCTVPNYADGSTTISSAKSNWDSSAFTGNFTAQGFNIDSSTDLSTINQTIGEQVLSPQPFAENGTEVICTASIQVTEKTCTVPNVVNKSNTAATTDLTTAGFTTITNDVRPGITTFTVGTQSPAGTSTTFCSAPVTIGEKKCTVPEFRGTNSNNRTTLWSGAEFTGTLTYAGPSGANLTWQSIPPGEVQFCDASIEVKEAKTCTIDPDLIIGQNASTAQTNWTTAGFYGNTFDATAVADGETIDALEFRNPVSGEMITPTLTGGNYSIDCATLIKVDDQACTVPDMSRPGVADSAKKSLTEARSDWADAGFQADQLITEKFLSDSDKVKAQSVPAGTALICSSSVTITGTGCVVPDLVGKSASAVTSIWTGAGFTGTLNFSLAGSGINSTNLSTNSPGTSWNGFTTFAQTPTRGDLRACSTTGHVYNTAPTNVDARTTTANTSNGVTEYTVNITWDFPFSAGRYYVFTCESNNKNSTCNPVVDRNNIESSASIVRFNENPVFTDKPATHIFTTSSTNKRRCYSVVARNVSGDSLTPQSVVTSTTPGACVIY
ncbi:hypothetical protein NIES970_18390 [[Synechococcus] sp. NIES-970]|nr:hypothetical protein NIES970_18390 [[Synechococcus] sp. NIES-970]